MNPPNESGAFTTETRIPVCPRRYIFRWRVSVTLRSEIIMRACTCRISYYKNSFHVYTLVRAFHVQTKRYVRFRSNCHKNSFHVYTRVRVFHVQTKRYVHFMSNCNIVHLRNYFPSSFRHPRYMDGSVVLGVCLGTILLCLCVVS